MKYRTKLYLAFIGIALFSTILGLGVVYLETKNFLFKELQSKVLSIAATAATMMDPELLKKAHASGDEKSPAFIQVQEILRKTRDANRRTDIRIHFLYTLMLSSKDPNVILFGVDSEENPALFSRPGDINPDAPMVQLQHHLEAPFSYQGIIDDQWGQWLIGYAPVFDKNGGYVGTIGADISAASVYASIHRLLLFEVPALLASLLLAAIAATFLSRQASLSLTSLCNGVEEIGRGNFDCVVHLKTNDEFNAMANSINQMTRGLKERERLKVGFARYVSGHVLEKIIKSETPTKLEGERRKVTVLFSDIRNFTRLAEKLPPETIVSLLNQYFEAMLEAIFTNQGTLDKFLGDGIMVEFGAPLDDANQEKNAVLTAIMMQKLLKKLCDKWEKEGKPRIEMGIGIHTGLAIVGNIGSETRMEYTAIGDTVNVASRLQHKTKTLNLPILVSEETFKNLKDQFPAHDLGPITLHGREKEIVAYAVDVS